MDLIVLFALIPILCLLAMSCVPSHVANLNRRTIRQLITFLIGIEWVFSSVLAVAFTFSSDKPLSILVPLWMPKWDVNFSVYYDGVTSLLLPLVSFVGFVVSRFSIRYLDGEASQGQYFRWLGFTIGAVSLMVISGNLLLFFAAWVMTSLGLHRLLLHYSHRPAAHRAAWTKFAISRIGDALLVAALIVIFQTFGTFEMSTLFAIVKTAGAESSAAQATIAWLLIFGAVTKSAQFPFHTWLPDTMETPTPVSALMHAGIVNAGGYLVIRMSPLIVAAPVALGVLALIGAFTACFAGVVMMAQSSVKRTLAYSTIAQMGFMMLQCGLGAYSAAMLHILAHSLYKAHAFLTSGSAVTQSLAVQGAASTPPSRQARVAYLVAAGAVAISAYVSITSTFGVEFAAKPGGLVLAFILCLALSTWGWRLFTLRDRRVTLAGIVGMVALCLAYVTSYLAVDQLLGTAVPAVSLPSSARLVLSTVALAFCVLFTLHALLLKPRHPAWLAPLRVHAANGFYVDAVYQRLMSPFAKSY